ncbi:MAG: hypothetical protein A2X49_07695 [Lentisphaerae bacterium GWF2_52_8]|nr:MAG: hypothetical protein A2X49_07695 [Lentisphaerae bacterium GWF2_52_8]
MSREINEIMPLSNIPDWKERLARQDAFLSGKAERPVVHIVVPRAKQEPPLTERRYKTLKDRWLDPVYVAETATWRVRNTEYLGDALPAAWPNLGPEVFSAYFGAELEYSETTAWAVPNLHNWADADKLVFSEDNFYWKKTRELTDALLEAGKGLFYTGITDIHPGGDAVAAFRDPLNLNMDMLDNPDELKNLLARLEKSYFELFDKMHGHLRAAGQPCSSWIGIVSSKKFYIPSNDFSCMISPEMFNEFFLPGFIRECQHLEASIYHLDGPDAVRHLDSLLKIKELSALQWVRGAGRSLSQHCIDIYKKCQAADKGIFLYISSMEELEFLVENLSPRGVWLSAYLPNRLEAEAVLRRIDRWA